MKLTLCIFLALILTSCGAVPHAHVKCTEGWRNDTDGVLSNADLDRAWRRAQLMIATGQWVINALDCSGPNIPCETHAADQRALNERPECFGVRGVHGTVYDGHYGVTDDSHNIAIDIDLGHDQSWNYASYEMENALGIRLGFPIGNR